MKQIFNKILHWLPVVAILAFGAYLRLHMIRGYMTFLGDEGRDVLVVMHMIVDHKFTLLGPTASVGGFFLGPIYYYFMLPFLWLWRLDPVGPAIMVALFGVATIYLVYRVGKDLFDEWAGLIAASAYACSPLVITYSRSSWNPNVVPFFAILLVYLLWKLIVRPRKLDAFWIGLVLGIGIQLHYLFLFLFMLVAVWYLWKSKSIGFWKTTGKTFAGFLVGVSPFLAFEVRHGFANTRTIIQFLFAGKDTGFDWTHYFSTIGDVIFRMYGRLLYRIPEESVWSKYPVWYISSIVITTKASIYISCAFILLILSYSISRCKNILDKYIRPTFSQVILNVSKESLVGVQLMFLWFLVVLLLFGLYKKAIYDYYFGIVFPLPFLLVSYTIAKLRAVKFGSALAVVLWAGIIVFNWQGRPFLYQPNNQLDQVERIARVALAVTDGRPFNFALIADGNSDHGYRYFFEIWGRAPVTIEPALSDPERKTVTNQLIVICETVNCQPLGSSLWEVAGFGRAEIVGVWDVPFVKIYKLVHYTGK